MEEYAKYLFCVRGDFFDSDYSLDEIKEALLSKEADDFTVIENTIIIFDLLGAETVIIVDERPLEKIDNISMERQPKLEEYLSLMSKRYSQSGMLQRLSSNEVGRFYTDFRRVQSMFNGYFNDILQCIDKACMLVLCNTNTSEYCDNYIYSILSILKGYKVYYVCDDVNDNAKIAKMQQKSMYKFMLNFMSSENQPYFLKLGISQMVNKGNAVLIRDYGNLIDMYSRILPCSIDETQEEENLELVFYSLDDIDKLINVDYVNDRFTSSQSINVSMSNYITNVRLEEHKGSLLRDMQLEFEDPVEGLLGTNSKFQRCLDNEITPIMSEKYRVYAGAVSKPSILINGVPTLLSQGIIEDTLLNEFVQQYCNILSEVFYGSKKPVYLQDIAIISYKGEKLLTVQGELIEVRHDLVVKLNIEIPDEEDMQSEFRIIGDSTQLLKVNAPMFTGTTDWVDYTQYQKSLMVKSMYSYLTQHFKMNEQAHNIPVFSMFCKEDDTTFSDDTNRTNLLKRRILLYYSLEKIKKLTVENYISIPRSYRDVHLDAFGDFGNRWSGKSDSSAGQIILRL